MASDKNQFLGGFVWKFSERIFTQGISFVISVILARMLMPEQYGLVAMINVFMAFANVFVTSGFTASLVQKKDSDDLDFSTIFYCNFIMSIIIYGIIYFCAPAIAAFFNMPDLCLLTRVYALSLIVTSYQTVQQAYISRNLLFKKTFVSSSLGTLLSGCVGVAMAYLGFGVWALVGQYMASIIFKTFILMYVIPWRLKWMFSWKRAKTLMTFGGNILLSTLAGTLYKEIRQLIIGKMYSPADLGLYNRGGSLPRMIRQNMDMSIRSVLFPVLSNHSDDKTRMKQMIRRGIKTSSYVTFFFYTMLAITAKPLILFLLTEKWLACVPYMQISCVAHMFFIISGYNVQAIKALGEGKEVLKLEMFKKPIFLVIIFVAAKFGVLAIALTSPINALYAMVMNMKPTRKLLDYKFREQVMDIVPPLLMATLVAMVTLPFLLFDFHPLIIMALQVIVGTSFFVIVSKTFKLESYYYINQTITDILKKKFRHG